MIIHKIANLRPNLGDVVLVKGRFVDCWIEVTFEGNEWRNRRLNILFMVHSKDEWCKLPEVQA